MFFRKLYRELIDFKKATEKDILSLTEQKWHVTINFLAEQLGKFKQIFAEVLISLKAELRQKNLKKLKKVFDKIE